MKIDPRRVLVGLAMAGSLIIFPPAVGYAVGGVDTGIGVQATQSGAATDVLKRHRHQDNDNSASGALPAPPPPAPGPPIPPPLPPGVFAPAAAPPAPEAPPAADSGDDPYYQYHNDPNNN